MRYNWLRLVLHWLAGFRLKTVNMHVLYFLVQAYLHPLAKRLCIARVLYPAVDTIHSPCIKLPHPEVKATQLALLASCLELRQAILQGELPWNIRSCWLNLSVLLTRSSL